MVNVRPPISNTDADPTPRARFNVLVTQSHHAANQPWSTQLGRLLEPQGVRALLAKSGRQALDTLEQTDIHAAVVDLATPQSDAPTSANPASTTPGGLWLLEVIARRPNRFPVVVVDTRPVASREVERALSAAMRLGAFSVISRPRDVEALLPVIRRLLDRHYQGQWPTRQPPDTT